MCVTVTFHLLWMLCALGAVALTAASATRWRRLAALSAGYAGSLALIGARTPPDAEAAGLLAAGSALVFLFVARYAWLAALCGGTLAATGVRMLVLAGAPAPAAIASMAMALALTAWLVRHRRGFASELVRDEALVIVCLLGLAVAMLPGVLDGWRAAASLNVSRGVTPDPVPVWTMLVVGLAVLMGATHALWSRR